MTIKKIFSPRINFFRARSTIKILGVCLFSSLAFIVDADASNGVANQASHSSLRSPVETPRWGDSGVSSAGNPVGSISGKFTVNANGAATYAIPIATPPGTAGI